MALLSLFMTSTGIFCFVPISQRLVESGIIPASNSWRFRRLPSVLAPTFYAGKEERLHADDAVNAWPEAEVSVSLVVAATMCNLSEQECHQIRSPPVQIPPFSADYTLTTDQQLALPRANESNIDVASPLECSTTNVLLQSTSIDTFYGPESTSFISVGVVSDFPDADTSQTRLYRILPSATAVTPCCDEKSLQTTFRASYAL